MDIDVKSLEEKDDLKVGTKPVKAKPQPLQLTKENCWSMFPQIWCINLEDRLDRKQSSMAFFQKHQIPVEYFTAKRHAGGSEHGVFDSHIQVMKRALEQDPDVSHVLIFEDDVDMLNHPTAETINDVRNFLNSTIKWDIFFLGAYPNIVFDRTKWVNGFSHIYKTHSQLSHAYVVSRSFMERMITVDYEVFCAPIDALYLLMPNNYAIFPTWFYQTDSPSDVSKQPRYNNFIRKMAVQFKGFYASTVNCPLIYILIVVIVILVLIIFLLLYYLAK